MTMRGFYEVFPELADPDRGTVEMFMVELTEPWGEVPADSYCFMELYCDVPGCDCRRVSILVVSVDLENESAEVCLRLDGAGIFPGPYLDSLGPRPPHSQGLLELVKRVLERMPDYLPRLQRHYMMFKAHCEGRPYTGAPFPPKAPTLKALPGSAGEAPRHRVGRNAPCPCGLGRAYRQCCMTRLRPAPAGTNAAGIGPPATPQPGAADAAQSQPLEETMLQSTRELVDQVLAWRGNPSNRGRWGAEVQTTLETNRNLSLPLLRLLLTHYAPAGRKHTPLAGYDACLALLGASLRRLRLETERRWPWAIALCEQVQTEMAQLGFVPEMDSRVQDDLLRALYDAKLEMTLLMHERALAIQDHYARFGAAHGGHDLNHLLERMRRDLDTDDAFRHLDPVLAHLSPLPGETLVRTVAGMMVNPQPIGKELAMLLLLQPDVRVRRTLAERFRSGGGVARLTQRGLRRLIGLRNWLPADERPAVDELIKVVRRAGVVSAPLPQVQPAAFYASPFDGWGGYRLWAFVKDGQHHRMGAVLIRQGLGVVEISWQNGLTKDAMDEEVRNLIADSAIAVDPDFVPRAIAHFIAVGLDQGYPPPPHLLELNELVGGDYWKPAAVDPAAAIAALTATDPAAFTPERVAAAFAAADTWPQEQGFAGDWIEEGAAVNQLLLTEVGPPAHWVEQLSLAAAVITIGVMEHKRDLWIERLLWEALRARAARDRSPVPWQDFLILARALHEGVALSEVPLTMQVALRSVERAQQRAQGG